METILSDASDKEMSSEIHKSSPPLHNYLYSYFGTFGLVRFSFHSYITSKQNSVLREITIVKHLFDRFQQSAASTFPYLWSSRT